MRNFFLLGTSFTVLACVTLSSNQVVLPTEAPELESTSMPTVTSVPEAPPTIAITNYLNFAPIHTWDVQNINKITGIVLSPDKQKVALFTFRSPEQWWLELRDTKSGD